jgi:hypothetical protein
MTEQEWMACTDPDPMLAVVRGKASDRKLRLFDCGCCRRIWHLLEEQGQMAVIAGEQFADGLITEKELLTAWLANETMIHRREGVDAIPATFSARVAAGLAGHIPNPYSSPQEDGGCAAWHAAFALACVIDPNVSVTRAGVARESRKQTDLLRHLIGNPFRAYPAPDHWPQAVVQLADALYNGQDCSFALHDALLEAGHAQLANHFRKEKWHPKGCWVVDLILDRK